MRMVKAWKFVRNPDGIYDCANRRPSHSQPMGKVTHPESQLRPANYKGGVKPHLEVVSQERSMLRHLETGNVILGVWAVVLSAGATIRAVDAWFVER